MVGVSYQRAPFLAGSALALSIFASLEVTEQQSRAKHPCQIVVG